MPYETSPEIDFSAIGLVVDVPANAVPTGGWSNSLNVRCKNGSVQGVNAFVENYKKDTDFHQLVAGIAKIDRSIAKTINLGLFYGMGKGKLAASLELDKEEAKEYVLTTVRENDVKFIRLWFTDILGALKGFVITSQELEEALNQGVGFDGSAIDGFARIDENDMVAMPDPSTFRILPWRPKQNAVVGCLCRRTHIGRSRRKGFRLG